MMDEYGCDPDDYTTCSNCAVENDCNNSECENCGEELEPIGECEQDHDEGWEWENNREPVFARPCWVRRN